MARSALAAGVNNDANSRDAPDFELRHRAAGVDDAANNLVPGNQWID
jgi:hypothetical protein